MENKQRNISIDLIKCIAIIFVVAIHTSSDGFSFPLTSSHFFATTLIRSFVSTAVPLFLISSGALMLDPQKTLSTKKLWSKNILRLVVAMLFWALLYKLFYLIGTGNFNFKNVYHSIKEVLVFNQEFHLYYIHITLLVYAFLPITRAFLKSTDDSTLKYFIGLWFILGIVYPTVYIYWPLNLIHGFPMQWMINMTYSAIGYGVIGYYFTKKPLSLKTSIVFTLIGFLSTFVLTYMYTLKYLSLYDHFLGGMHIPVCVFAFGIFNLCKYISTILSKTIISAVVYISKASFCIYLVHIFVLRIFSFTGYNATLFHPALSIPLVTLSNVAVSLGIYHILSKIPIVNKWLI